MRQSFFSFQNNPKNLDLSRPLVLFRKGEFLIVAKLHRTDLGICSHSREGKTQSFSRINTVSYESYLPRRHICPPL